MRTPHGTLYLVPSTLDFGIAAAPADIRGLLPLGVLQRAASLAHWVCENAKTTRAFLKRVDAVVALARPLQDIAIVELPRPAKGRPAPPAAAKGDDGSARTLLAPALAGHDIGLICEAGLPALADPGAALVAAAHALDLRVVGLPGASAIALAVATGGLNGQSFAFVGYLPVDSHARAARIRELEAHSLRQGQTQVLIETPYRNQAVLDALLAHLHADTSLSTSLALTSASEWTCSRRVASWRQDAVSLPADVPAVFSFLARLPGPPS